MRLLKKHTDILKGLVKGKGIYKTKLIPKDKSIKEMETVVEMYLKGIITFENITSGFTAQFFFSAVSALNSVHKTISAFFGACVHRKKID